MISTTPATRQDVPGNPPAKKDATDKSAAMIQSFIQP
jgi:hypothetical protein